MIPTVLSIAGLDPSGGAGLTADIKTATVMNVYAMSVVTAVTVQHPGAVLRIEPMTPDIVQQQIEAVLNHMPVHAVKIGMLGNTDTADAVYQALQKADIPIILDPIHRSTSGQVLNQFSKDGWRKLFRLASVLTPNDDERGLVLGNRSPQDWVNQTHTSLLHTGVDDGTGFVEDTLWTPHAKPQIWRHSKIKTEHTHGTRCTLSTAIAAGMAKGQTLSEAINEAIQLTGRLIGFASAGGIVDHNGPLLHFKAFE